MLGSQLTHAQWGGQGVVSPMWLMPENEGQVLLQGISSDDEQVSWWEDVGLGCLCTSYCLMWGFFSDYFSCFLSRLIRWFVAFVLHCFSLFALFVVLKFSSPVSLLFSLWHWAQECSLVDYLNNYTPKCIPVKLADNKVIYSAGVGSVVFVPVIGGKKQRPVKFTNVLHVPDLRNNLLSVLYLCRSKGFLVSIDLMHMAFRHRPGPVLFMANIGNSNCALLDGETAPLVEFASAATTVPLDLNLWHRRFAHHHLTDVKALLHCNLVIGMAIDSKTVPDPICEPCLAGKMHANPFPSSLTSGTCPYRCPQCRPPLHLWVPLLDHFHWQLFAISLCYPFEGQVTSIWGLQDVQGLCWEPKRAKNQDTAWW